MEINNLIRFLALFVFIIATSFATDDDSYKNCKGFCKHLGCTGFYCGEECICECNADNNPKVFESLSNVKYSAEKLKVPFQILIQGPTNSKFLREASEFVRSNAKLKEEPCCKKLISDREKRSTVVIYSPPDENEASSAKLQQKIIQAKDKVLEKRDTSNNQEKDKFSVFKPWFKQLNDQTNLFRSVRLAAPLVQTEEPITTLATTTTTVAPLSIFKMNSNNNINNNNNNNDLKEKPDLKAKSEIKAKPELKSTVFKRSFIPDLECWKSFDFFPVKEEVCHDVDLCKSADKFEESVRDMKFEWDKLLNCVSKTVESKSKCGWNAITKQRFLRSLENAPFMEPLKTLFPKIKASDLVDNSFWENGKINNGECGANPILFEVNS